MNPFSFDSSFSSGSFDFGGAKQSSAKLDLKDPEVLNEILAALGQTPPKARANFFDYLLALPSAIGSIPDAFYQSKKKGTNVFSEYGDNLKEGLNTLLTGEKASERFGVGDILKDAGIFAGDDWVSKIGRGTAGFVGDVLLDPTTYLTFGAAGVAKGAAQAGAKEVAKKLATEGAEAVAKQGLNKAAQEGTESVIKKILLGNSDDTARFFGKEISSNPEIVKALKLITNPVGEAAGVAFRGAKQVAPELVGSIEETFNKTFRPGEFEKSKGLGNLFSEVQDYRRTMEAVPTLTATEIVPLVNQIKSLPENIQQQLPYFVEGTLKAPSPEIQNIVDSVIETNQKYGNQLRDIGVLPTSPDLNGLVKVFRGEGGGEFSVSPDKLQFGYGKYVSDNPEIAKLYGKVTEGFLPEAKLFNSEEKFANQDFMELAQEASKKFGLDEYTVNSDFSFLLSQGLNDHSHAVRFLEGAAKDLGKKISRTETTEFINEFLRKKGYEGIKYPAKEAAKLGSELGGGATGSNYVLFDQSGKEILPSVQEVPYIARQVVGFKEDFIKNKFGEVSDMILNNETVKDQLRKNGFVSKDALNQVLESSPGFSTSIKGLRNPDKYLEDAANERTFKTLKEGEDAGVVYNKNAAELVATGAIRSDKAKQAYDFAQKLDTLTDDTGNKLFYKADQIKDRFEGRIPPGLKEFEIENVGKFVAPKEAVDILKNYASDFFGDEGTKGLLKAYDQFLKVFKSTVTAKGPGVIGYSVRNALGDFQNMLIGGFRNRGNAFGVGAKIVGFQKEALKNGIEAATKKYGSEARTVYEQAVKNGIVGAGEVSDITGKGIDKLVKRGRAAEAADKIGKVTDRVFGIELQKAREDTFRIANFFDAYKRTGDWRKAGEAARLSSLDYANLTPFERNVAKRIIPFYSFLRQNLELQLKTFSKSPGTTLAYQKLLDNISDTFSSSNLTEEDYAALPDWMKQGPFAVMRKDGGSGVNVITGFGDSLSAVNNVLSTDPKETLRNLLESSSPLVKTPVELAIGKSLFTDTDIKGRTSGERFKDMPAPIKDLLGYKEVKRTIKDSKTGKMKEIVERTVDATAAYTLSNLPVISPYVTQTKRVQEAAANPTLITNLVSGGRIYEADLDVEKAKREREKLKLLQEALIDAGYAKEFSTVSIPKEEKEKLLAMLGSQ